MRRKPCPSRPLASAAAKWSKRMPTLSPSKPRAPRRARASSGDKRQRLRETGAAARVDRARELGDRLGGLGAGVGEDERHPRVGRLAQPHVERHLAEQPDAELRREPLAAARAE